MSSFSTIYYNPSLISLTKNSPAIASDFWASPLITNNGIEALLCFLYCGFNDGAGNYALKVFLVEEVISTNGVKTNLVIAEATVNTVTNGGTQNNNRVSVLFQSVGMPANAPTIVGSPFGIGGSTTGLLDADGLPAVTNNATSRASVSTTAYFPEKFRVLYQNVGAGSASFGQNYIRVIR